MDGLYSKTLLKWMIWGYHYFRKHPYIGGSCHLPWGERRSFTTATGHLLRHQIRHSSAGGGKLLLGASWKGLRSLLATSLGKHLWDTEKKKHVEHHRLTHFWVSFGIIRCKSHLSQADMKDCWPHRGNPPRIVLQVFDLLRLSDAQSSNQNKKMWRDLESILLPNNRQNAKKLS